MEGRLSPKTDGRFQSFPKDSWRQEFPRASQSGLSRIEWIYDFDTAELNPLTTDVGIAQMKALNKDTGIEVRSLCADGFVEEHLINTDGSINNSNVEKLLWLMDRSRLAGIQYIVLPFVDFSSLKTSAQKEGAATLFSKLSSYVQEGVLELHIESDFNPGVFGDFMKRVTSNGIKVNYDTGNSASLGYDPVEEFRAYGSKIGSVHIKDRIRGGGTVPLGQGDTQIPLVLKLLHQVGYDRYFTLQAARQKEDNEVATVSGYVSHLRRLLNEVTIDAK